MRTLWLTGGLMFCAAAVQLSACQSGHFVKEETKAAGAGSVSAAIPPPPPPKGPVGSVVGIIRVSGDEPPSSAKVMAEIPAGKCKRAAAMYSKLFREGAGRTLGDVLVAVTDYAGSVPTYTAPVKVVAADCAFSSRTVALTAWQGLEVQNKGPEAVMPQLVGSTAPAVLVALPGGPTVPLPFKTPGEYVIVDRSHPFAQVDVFVLNFPTFAVTEVDGSYRIDRIPVGEAKLTAFLPATGKKVEQRVVITANETQHIDLTVSFDLKSDGPRPVPSATP